MLIIWSEEEVQFVDLTHDRKFWTLKRIQHCQWCTGDVWRIVGDPHHMRFRTPQGCADYIKEELRDHVCTEDCYAETA